MTYLFGLITGFILAAPLAFLLGAFIASARMAGRMRREKVKGRMAESFDWRWN